ncbi:hypothetical protein JCM18237_18850 [Halorubrum luteum]
MINDSFRVDPEKLESLCEELFEEVKAIVRQRKDQHPEAIYDEKKRAAAVARQQTHIAIGTP